MFKKRRTFAHSGRQRYEDAGARIWTRFWPWFEARTSSSRPGISMTDDFVSILKFFGGLRAILMSLAKLDKICVLVCGPPKLSEMTIFRKLLLSELRNL